MAKQIIWTPEAEATFEKVIAYLLENWTEKEIRNFVTSTFSVIAYISEHPFMFRKTNKRNVREALVTPHNLLIYKVYPDRIDLITFWDTRQNPLRKKF
ncbi:MAG: type II toxin-antitoxin system RelE/ParE family toxin [Bacteroidia bacterium]|nr:type II toxin-antitoxin system RelE/ParE family toxin [Bacteroidia bacterium]